MSFCDCRHIIENPIRFLIMGHAQHGKDAVAEILAKKYNLRFKNNSLIFAKYIIMPAAKDKYDCVENCYEDRVNCREFWFDTILEYGKKGKFAIYNLVGKESDIYCGIRSKHEYNMISRYIQTVFWVHNPWVEKESMKICEVKCEDADIIIINDESILDLEWKIEEAINLYPKFVAKPNI